jgi:hypothetical protein
LHRAIHVKLAQFVKESPVLPEWSAALASLGPESTEEEHLTVYQAIRTAGTLPEEASFFLVAWQIDVITFEHAEEALREQEDRLEAIKRQHGLAEDDSWPPNEGPPEYEEALEQLHDAWDALDRERFEQIQEGGRQFFHGSSGDEDNEIWLDTLLQAVCACVEADSPMGPLGMNYRVEEDFWEICIFPTPVELVGGAQDGAVVALGFTVDLEQLRASFDSIEAFGWNALGLNDPDGPHIHVEGKFLGREVFLQLLAYAPEDEETGLKFDVTKCAPKPE